MVERPSISLLPNGLEITGSIYVDLWSANIENTFAILPTSCRCRQSLDCITHFQRMQVCLWPVENKRESIFKTLTKGTSYTTVNRQKYCCCKSYQIKYWVARIHLGEPEIVCEQTTHRWSQVTRRFLYAQLSLPRSLSRLEMSRNAGPVRRCMDVYWFSDVKNCAKTMCPGPAVQAIVHINICWWLRKLRKKE